MRIGETTPGTVFEHVVDEDFNTESHPGLLTHLDILRTPHCSHSADNNNVGHRRQAAWQRQVYIRTLNVQDVVHEPCGMPPDLLLGFFYRSLIIYSGYSVGRKP